MSNLIHLVYLSVSSAILSEEELDIFLSEIRKNNQKLGVTGLLLYNDEFFIQVIEGTRDTIHNLFNVIKTDPRHSNIVKLLDEPIASRAFPDWSMGFRRMNDDKTSNIPGFSTFMHAEHPEVVPKGITKEVMYLLNNFRKHI